MQDADATPELWRHVLSNVEAMREHAPDGYEPVIRILVSGRSEPLEVASFEGRGDLAWTFFAGARHVEDSDPHEGHPDDVFLFANDAAIVGVELGYRRSTRRRSVGFTSGGFQASSSE